MPGEGHFLALLRKKKPADALDGGRNGAAKWIEDRTICLNSERRAEYRKSVPGGLQGKAAASKAEMEILQEFLRDVSMPMDISRLEIRKGQAYYVPKETKENRGLVFLRNGLYLGEVKKDRFEPSQSFAMALKKEEYAAAIDLSCGDERVVKYLKGETIEVDDLAEAKGKGWQLVCVNGYPLGWGKLANGTLKNKYHPGWRMKY